MSHQGSRHIGGPDRGGHHVGEGGRLGRDRGEMNDAGCGGEEPRPPEGGGKVLLFQPFDDRSKVAPVADHGRSQGQAGGSRGATRIGAGKRQRLGAGLAGQGRLRGQKVRAGEGCQDKQSQPERLEGGPPAEAPDHLGPSAPQALL